MKHYTFYEETADRKYPKSCSASNNSANYVLWSANAHDMYTDYVAKYNRLPSSRWYNKYFSFYHFVK